MNNLITNIFSVIKFCSKGAIRDVIERFLKCIQSINRIIKEHPYDKKLGINTGGYYCYKDLSQFGDAVLYGATPYSLIEKIIDYLRLKENDIFIDFGCGKGRVIFMIAKQKLKKVIGIEVNKNLIGVINKNLRNFKGNTPIEVIEQDACNSDVSEGTIFFFYNPFGLKTFKKVLYNIKKSLDKNPRKIKIIYYHPINKDFIDNLKWLKYKGKIDEKILVWENK